MIRVILTGDVMLGRLVDQLMPDHNENIPEDRENYTHAYNLLKHRHPEKVLELQQDPYKYVWGDTLPFLADADLRVINLETSITQHQVKWPHKAFNFRMHPANIKILKAANVNFASVANNHALDFSYEGLIETIDVLRATPIRFSGAGLSAFAAAVPGVLEAANGRKVCIFSFTDHPKEWAATDTRPGVNFVDVLRHHSSDIDRIADLVKKYTNFDPKITVIFSIHWGSNYEWVPPDAFEKFAHSLIDRCGVHLIHGHSAHHVQGIEFYKGHLILYGCGDFVDDYAVDSVYRNNLGFAYRAELAEDGKCSRVELLPVKIHSMQVSTQMGYEEFEWLSAVISKLSSTRYGTRVNLISAEYGKRRLEALPPPHIINS